MQKFFILFILLTLCVTITNVNAKANTNANSYRISNKCKKQIMKRESCSLTVYKDNTGYSIGYGHRLKKGENYKKISKAKAEQLFREDIKYVEAAVNRILKDIKFKPTQNFIDGLGDLVYNCGETGVKKSEFYKRLCRCRVKNGKVNQNDFNYTVAAVKTMRLPSAKTGLKNGVAKRRYETYKQMINVKHGRNYGLLATCVSVLFRK